MRRNAVIIFMSLSLALKTPLSDCASLEPPVRDQYVDYKMKMSLHALTPEVISYVDEYQQTGLVNTELKFEDNEPVINILQDLGIPANKIYVYKRKQPTYPEMAGITVGIPLFALLMVASPLAGFSSLVQAVTVCATMAGVPALGTYFVTKTVGEILYSNDAEYEYVTSNTFEVFII